MSTDIQSAPLTEKELADMRQGYYANLRQLHQAKEKLMALQAAGTKKGLKAAQREVASLEACTEHYSRLRHYWAIAQRAAELGLPKSYQTDLTKHDRRALQMQDARQPFGWSIGECGTRLFTDADFCLAVGRAERGQTIHWHYWNGDSLVSVASAELLAELLTPTCPECGGGSPNGAVCRDCLRAELDGWAASVRS